MPNLKSPCLYSIQSKDVQFRPKKNAFLFQGALFYRLVSAVTASLTESGRSGNT